MAYQRATWTWDEERMFQIALSTYVEGTRNRWKKIAELIPVKSAKDVEEYYPILKANIEAMEKISMAYQRATWTWDEERMFQIALSTYVEGTRNRWKKIAELIPVKSAKDVEEYYPILKANIEAMESSFTQLQTNTNNNASSQSREENEEVGSLWDLDELVSCSQVYQVLNKK
ncbi:dnaJ homolog subfamily C member 2-like [Ipomoea triloba]|uniref:dnaJ homolog subfamily C member 2-like n=1 Tax=Ipomoea triloba TaxID=35885 RepID=UPI00125E5660|nr:dnaJ homolog subfamily C member 2-like [Ipomoea triloba]